MGSRSGVAMLVVTVGRRFRAGRERLGEELLVGFGFFCCWSWSESWKGGLAVLGLGVGCRGSGGGEVVVLEGENIGYSE